MFVDDANYVISEQITNFSFENCTISWWQKVLCEELRTALIWERQKYLRCFAGTFLKEQSIAVPLLQ